MPSSLLFAINNEGRVYALSTGNSTWREFLYQGLDFKIVSTVPHFLWAIGGDRQVYLHVHGLDVPIRVKEESYENERWLPLDGFSSRLLPTDRFQFSNVDGTQNRAIDTIRLPSMAWQWEGDWHIDNTLEGHQLEHDGWTYAIDFPAKYQPKKQWNSCVRRRKWIRFRRYSALNSWCAVSPLHKDPTEEPFVDCAIGGQHIPNAPVGTLVVWAVTAHGRVMFRSGVSTNCPEGVKWTAISTPSGCDVCQISVGATGLVWVTLHNGRALVRSKVTRDSLYGESWLEVKPPGNNLKILQISVGTNSVWCLTNDHHVWFRRGIKGELSGISEDAAIGNKWIEMIGNIANISVAANDQVFAVGSEDRCLYVRSGVSISDPTGKKWRTIQCSMQMSRTSSIASFGSKMSGSSSPGQRHRSLSSLYKDRSLVETPATIENVECSSISSDDMQRKESGEWGKTPPKVAGSLQQQDPRVGEPPEISAYSAPVNDVKEYSGRYFNKALRNPRSYSPVRSAGSVVGTEAHPESDVFDADNSRNSAIFGEDDDHLGSQNWTECDMSWTYCSAGAVTIDPNRLPNWFNSVNPDLSLLEVNQPWRIQLMEKLKIKYDTKEVPDIEKYVKAVEMSSWTKSGEAKVAKLGHPFEECLIQLEWISSSAAGLDSGTLTILNADGASTKMQFSLSEISCVMCSSEPGNPRITIHLPRLPSGSSPIRLQFNGDSDMEDWLSHLSSVCCELNDVGGKPSNQSIWTVSNLGEVFVFDPVHLAESQYNKQKELFVMETDVSAAETPYFVQIPNGLSPGDEIEINGCVYDDADHIRFDLQSHPIYRVRHKVEKLRQVLLHLNPRLNEGLVILNSMENSEWKDEMRTTKMLFTQGKEFNLVFRCETNGFRILVNDEELHMFRHRAPPESINELYVSGRVKLFKLFYNHSTMIVPIRDIFWRQIGGHLRRVETCAAGVTWGIGYDGTAWAYTGGWGGSFLKGLEKNKTGINNMIDIQNFYVYENQRWNPLTGYKAQGLPTDRHMWSDVTGKHKRSKEHTKLLSMHWQWISDWIVDFHTPGGVDREGWQYAVDFPATYHGKKQFTDYVRRRRWYRRCRLASTGPWQEVGNTKILNIAIQRLKGHDPEKIVIWAIAMNGDILMRDDVTIDQPCGTRWEHISCDQPLIDISCDPNGQVWAIGRNGCAYYRFGITRDLPHGESWQTIDPPTDSNLKQIAIGERGIWVVDINGRLAVRKEVTKTFPEGSHWLVLQNPTMEPPHAEGNVGFKCVSVGKEVWALSKSGYICKRCGITKDNPVGTGWSIGIQANWQHISMNAF